MTRLQHYDHEGTARFVMSRYYRNLRGLVSEPGKWRWSSYNCYCGSEDVLLRVDRIQI